MPILRYDGQPLTPQQAEILLHADWRIWLTLNGYEPKPPVVLEDLGGEHKVTIEIWKGPKGDYAVYQPPVGLIDASGVKKGNGTECLYLSIKDEKALAELLELARKVVEPFMRVMRLKRKLA